MIRSEEMRQAWTELRQAAAAFYVQEDYSAFLAPQAFRKLKKAVEDFDTVAGREKENKAIFAAVATELIGGGEHMAIIPEPNAATQRAMDILSGGVK